MKKAEKETGKKKAKNISNINNNSLFLDKELRKRLFISRVRLMGRFFELGDWLIVIASLYFFINLYPFRWEPLFFFINLLAISQSLIYHRAIFHKLAEKKPSFALSFDIFFLVLMLLLAANLAGGIASPMVFSYVVALGIASFLFTPYFVFVLLSIEILFIYLATQVDPLQQNFAINSSNLLIWEIAILFFSSVSFFTLSYIYKKRSKKLEKLQNFYNQLTAEKVKSEAVLESMSDSVFVVDSQKRLVFLNKAAENLIKISSAQKANLIDHFYGNVFKLRINDKDLDYTKDCPIQLAMTERKPNFRKDLSVLTIYKKPVFITLSAAPVIDAAGDSKGAVVVMRDITKEREIERIQMEFVSIASHELLTPITQAQGHLSMIMDENIGKMDETATKIVGNAYQGIKRISRLVRDLMNVSRIERGTMKMNLVEIDIIGFLQGVVRDFQKEAESNDLRFAFRKPFRGISKAFGDPDRLSEVLNNLIGNAMKFTKKGGITIGVSEKQDGYVVVSVEDTGVGIPKENIGRLFEKFYQVDSSATREAQGTGLGLYISKMIIEMMHGKIWVESKIGKGSMFYFSLPKMKKLNNKNKSSVKLNSGKK